MPCHGAPAVWAATRTASLLAPSALVRIADRPSYHIIGSSYNMTIWLSSQYATAPVMKSTGRPKDRRQSARYVGRARWSEGNAGDRDWRPGMGAELAMGRALRGPVGACCALPYCFGANLRPVQKARPASAVMTAAKIMCAVSGPKSADS